jgi:ABC-type spermidine/putrescine transport system permease subunit II
MTDGRWLVYLAVPAAWTIFFSMFNTPGVRGWRNLGWPTCYLVGVAMFWSIGWRRAGIIWLCIGFATGFLYYLYQVWSATRVKDPAAKAQLSTILHGALAWPIMLPEVVEYSLADAGVLKATRTTEPPPDLSPKNDGA